MYNEFDKARLKQIHDILMEFGSGKFPSRLERSDLNDDMEALFALVNMTIEEVSDFFHHKGYANQNETYHYLIRSFFILDNHDIIVAYNSNIKELLFFDDKELNAIPFDSLLNNKSKSDWKLLKFKLAQKGTPPDNEFIVLSFKTKQDSIFIMYCLVNKVLIDIDLAEGLIISSVEIKKDSEKRKRELYLKVTAGQHKDATNNDTPSAKHIKYEITLKSGDLIKLKKVYEYIQENLNKPLPPLKKLAASVGTNEYRLKHGFKKLYGQTVYSFLKSERLRKARQLVKSSDIPFKTIFKVTGFKHASHFSKAFKKKYGLTPKDMREQSFYD